jgi:hypothetical protein
VGAKLHFPLQVVHMGLPSAIPRGSKVVSQVAMNSSDAQGCETHTHEKASLPINTETPQQEDKAVEMECTSSVYASLKLGLDFSHGRNFSKDVMHKFHSSVHSSNNAGHFMMVVYFARANFRMEGDLVALALEASLGGFCGELLVSSFRDRVFSFAVASKEVAFHILKLKQYHCQQFKCYFHLWSRGGPNWLREFSLWQRECQTEWTLVSPSKRTAQLGLSAMKHAKPKSIVRN